VTKRKVKDSGVAVKRERGAAAARPVAPRRVRKSRRLVFTGTFYRLHNFEM
jgi:hypothetical protein